MMDGRKIEHGNYVSRISFFFSAVDFRYWVLNGGTNTDDDVIKDG